MIIGYSVEKAHYFILFFSICSLILVSKICDLFTFIANRVKEHSLIDKVSQQNIQQGREMEREVKKDVVKIARIRIIPFVRLQVIMGAKIIERKLSADNEERKCSRV